MISGIGNPITPVTFSGMRARADAKIVLAQIVGNRLPNHRIVVDAIYLAARPRSSPTRRLHLCKTTINEQFRSRDVTAVVGCEKHDGLGYLIGSAEPAERNTAGHCIGALFAHV